SELGRPGCDAGVTVDDDCELVGKPATVGFLYRIEAARSDAHGVAEGLADTCGRKGAHRVVDRVRRCGVGHQLPEPSHVVVHERRADLLGPRAAELASSGGLPKVEERGERKVAGDVRCRAAEEIVEPARESASRLDEPTLLFVEVCTGDVEVECVKELKVLSDHVVDGPVIDLQNRQPGEESRLAGHFATAEAATVDLARGGQAVVDKKRV